MNVQTVLDFIRGLKFYSTVQIMPKFYFTLKKTKFQTYTKVNPDKKNGNNISHLVSSTGLFFFLNQIPFYVNFKINYS